jgi:solute:Na+ symporter, SSS family
MTAKLAVVDVLVVLLYVLGTTLLGVWFTRRQRDLRTYFVGDRNVSWWLVLVSIVATETSTVTFLSVPGLAFRDGGNLTFLQLSFGYILGRCLVAWLLLPQYLRGELFSAYQLLRQRFSPGVQRVASGLFLVTRTVADGLRLFLTGLLLQQFTGWDIGVSIVVMGLVTVLYTYLGGMQAVIWTDLIQFVIYILGAVVAAVFIVRLLPGGWDGLVTAGAAADKFRLFNFAADFSEPYTFWAGILGGAFLTMATHGADQLMVQRYLCSKSLGEARTALLLSGFVVLTQFLLFLMIGVGLYALRQAGQLPVTADTRNDEVFGLFIVRYLPQGVVGLVIAAVLAAAMSTLSSSLNSSANAFVSDFYKPLRPAREDGHYLLLSKVMTSVWGLAQIGVALLALTLQGDRSIIDLVLSVAGFTTGMVLGLFLLGSLPRPVSSGAAFVGLLAGFAAVLAVWLPSVALVRDALPAPVRELKLAWPWYAPIGTTVTVAVALVVDFASRPHGPSANGGPQPGLDEPR